MSLTGFVNLGFGMNFCLYKYWIENNKGKSIPKRFMKQMNKYKNKNEYNKYIIDNKDYYEQVINSNFFEPLYNIEKKIYKNIGDLDEDEFKPLFIKDKKTEKMVKIKFNLRLFFANKKSDYLCFAYEPDDNIGFIWFDQNMVNIIFKKIKKDIKKEEVKLNKYTFNLGGVNWYILNIDYNIDYNEEDICLFTYAHSKQQLDDFVYYFKKENNRDLMHDYLS